MESIEINNPKEMVNFGKELSKKYEKILLYGDLGAGKTHLVKGFAKGLGINEEEVTSPTYAIVNIYDNKLLHIDMYRIENFETLIDKGILDLIDKFKYICIEWPKREDEYKDENWIKLLIKKEGENKRNIIIKK